ncbi:MAG TPA: hypothetical protein VK468_11195, partial [Pyrinomonadaceae bacterium]|nr:hypothetical protein [Pyrinomonadaceae bacterium]
MSMRIRLLKTPIAKCMKPALLAFVIFCPAAATVISQPAASASTFLDLVNARAARSNHSTTIAVSKLDCNVETDPLARRVLIEYGAILAAADSVVVPPKCIFRNSDEVVSFHLTVKQTSIVLSGVRVELQQAAAASLERVQAEAAARGLRIVPLDGPVAAKRTYADTVRLWNSRFFPALRFWELAGTISETESTEVRNMPLAEQARKVMELEARGYNFGTGRMKSIFISTAPPGTSQHIAMLALDVIDYNNSGLRALFNDQGWFQTIVGDPAHFTFLGIPETE